MNFEAKLALDLIQEHRVSAFLGVTTMLNWMMAVDGFSRPTTSPPCATSSTAEDRCPRAA